MTISLENTIDSIVQDLSPFPRGAGMVIGVACGGHRWVLAYGLGQHADNPPDRSTLFEIGSLTKVFTTAMLAVCVYKNLVKLEDPVRSYLPDLINLPDTITLRNLATHTAGLPHMPAGSIWLLLKNRHDPFASVTIDDMLSYCRNIRLKPATADGYAINYSNLSLALLGHILSARLGRSYQEAVKQMVCKPLGLTDTTIYLSNNQRSRIATPHSSNGRTGSAWHFGAYAGAGGLRSTADDCLTFLDAHLSVNTEETHKMLRICHPTISKRFKPPGVTRRLAQKIYGHPAKVRSYSQGMALGWETGHLQHAQEAVWWRHGATGGYRAFAGFVKEKRLGIVVLSNSGLKKQDAMLGWTSTDEVGFRILEKLVESDCKK